MGAVDVERQALNVFRMKLLGAKVHPVASGTATLKDAMNEALRDWVTNVRDTHYVIGSVAGPHPYPTLVRDLQAVIGREARAQMQATLGRLPDAMVACVGGGSNAMGLFHAFVPDAQVAIFGVEAAGDGIATGRHAATLSQGRVGVLHGARSYVLCDDEGQIAEAHSISAGPRLPGRRPRALAPEGHRAGALPVGHRPPGAGRAVAAGPHRGHPVRAGERPRHRRPARGRPVAAARRERSSSTCRAAGTRT